MIKSATKTNVKINNIDKKAYDNALRNLKNFILAVAMLIIM